MHNTFDSKLNPRNPAKMLTSLSPRQQVMPAIGGSSSLSLPTSEEQLTKSMKKYERDLKLKNRVLREKEKAIFNNGVLKKLCQN